MCAICNSRTKRGRVFDRGRAFETIVLAESGADPSLILTRRRRIRGARIRPRLFDRRFAAVRNRRVSNVDLDAPVVITADRIPVDDTFSAVRIPRACVLIDVRPPVLAGRAGQHRFRRYDVPAHGCEAVGDFNPGYAPFGDIRVNALTVNERGGCVIEATGGAIMTPPMLDMHEIHRLTVVCIRPRVATDELADGVLFNDGYIARRTFQYREYPLLPVFPYLPTLPVVSEVMVFVGSVHAVRGILDARRAEFEFPVRVLFLQRDQGARRAIFLVCYRELDACDAFVLFRDFKHRQRLRERQVQPAVFRQHDRRGLESRVEPVEFVDAGRRQQGIPIRCRQHGR